MSTHYFSRPLARLTAGAILFFFATVAAGTAAAAGDAAAGQANFAVCMACHGAEGLGNQAMGSPNIAGQGAWYVERQLQAFQKGHRGTAPGDTWGATMRPMAMAVGDPTATANVSAYVASLPMQANAPTITGDAAAGAASYAVCAACHGQNAEGNQAMGAPRLAGQDDWYLVQQLKNYKTGLRAYDPADVWGAQMKGMAMTLADDAAINNVVAYISSLK
ncbi:MAG: c-type cytochrome [Pseudomonadota bacterium]